MIFRNSFGNLSEFLKIFNGDLLYNEQVVFVLFDRMRKDMNV